MAKDYDYPVYDAGGRVKTEEFVDKLSKEELSKIPKSTNPFRKRIKTENIKKKERDLVKKISKSGGLAIDRKVDRIIKHRKRKAKQVKEREERKKTESGTQYLDKYHVQTKKEKEELSKIPKSTNPFRKKQMKEKIKKKYRKKKD